MGFKGIDVINPTISFVQPQIPLWNDCTTNIVDVDSVNMNMTKKLKNGKTKLRGMYASNIFGILFPIDEIRKVFGGYIIEDLRIVVTPKGELKVMPSMVVSTL